MASDIGATGVSPRLTTDADLVKREKLDIAIQRATSDVVVGSKPDFAELQGAAARVNEAMKAYGLEFRISETGSRVVTRIVDRESGDLIRQIPDETVLHVAKRLDEVVGVLFEERA
jgi:flagellar protein FlaG